MLTRYGGTCFICGKTIKAREGDFQSVKQLPPAVREKYRGWKWVVRCFSCKGKGNIPEKK